MTNGVTIMDNFIVNPTKICHLAPEEMQDRVIQGDCLATMASLPSEIADMVFVDPPYYLQLPQRKLLRWNRTTVNPVDDQWDVFSGFPEYDAFSEAWLSECRRLMKPKATLWVIGTYHNIFRLGKIMQDLGFWLLNNVIWIKTNPVPNFLKVRFTNATETLIWAVKDRNVKGYTFDSSCARQFGVGKIGANVWEVPICSGKQRLKTESGEKLHSTQKPEELLRRVILVSTREGDTILDPMAGTGTTGAVARMLNRRFIMIEREKQYVEAIQKRLAGLPRQKERLE